MNPPDAVSEILTETKSILLDFDGPVCSIFAHLTAPVIAAELRTNCATPNFWQRSPHVPPLTRPISS
jgi:hypothetical protein